MPNTNCLENIACPTCGQDERFEIHATATFEVTDDGTSEGRNVQWDGNSAISCPACREFGRIKDFYPRESFLLLRVETGLYLGQGSRDGAAPSFEREEADTFKRHHPTARLVRVPTYPRTLSPQQLQAFGLDAHEDQAAA